MDDFLHNLRSGKLKQPDRQNRPYGDQQYKGGPRRNMMDRRKREADHKESFDRLNAIKEVLESLAETQKRMAEAYQERTRTEERKARAMEVLAKNIYRMLNPSADDADTLFAAETPAPPPRVAREQHSSGERAPIAPEPASVSEAEATEIPAPEEAGDAADSAPPDDDAQAPSAGRLTELDRQTLFAVINQLRSEGNNWESIARHIAGKGYPTLSGKGVWRGGMVKSLHEKMAAVES
jgi:hypothetical protein